MFELFILVFKLELDSHVALWRNLKFLISPENCELYKNYFILKEIHHGCTWGVVLKQPETTKLSHFNATNVI